MDAENRYLTALFRCKSSETELLRMSGGLNKKLQLSKGWQLFAVATGLEPATSGVTGRHSNQLNYTTDSFVVQK